MTESELPVAPGEIYAYRFWKVTPEGLLGSVTQAGVPWVDGENLAVCTRTVRDEPRVPDEPQRPQPPVRSQVAWEAMMQSDSRQFVDRVTNQFVDWAGPGSSARVVTLVNSDDDHPNVWPEARSGSPVAVEQDPGLVERIYQAKVLNYRKRLDDFPRVMQEWHDEVANFEQRLAAFRQATAEHIAPMPDCECGYYAVTDIDTAQHYTYGHICMIGVVQGYGKVQKYTKGYRFQKARIVALAPVTFPKPGGRFYLDESLGLFAESIVERKEDFRMSKVQNNYRSARMYLHKADLIEEWNAKVLA